MSDYDFCPDCDAPGSKVKSDFDPDQGPFFRCEECGECWSTTPKLTVQDVNDALDKSAKSADELNRNLESAFTLPPESWNLRLR